MTILVLGPSKWKRGHTPAIPSWVRYKVPEGWPISRSGQPSPLGIRAAVARDLQEQERAKATFMEAHSRLPGEKHTSLFTRLVREEAIDQYFLFWPYGSQRSGLDVEIGFLLLKMDQGEKLDIVLFVEAGERIAGRVENGLFVSREATRRTHYYEDLIAFGASLVEWDDYSILWSSLMSYGRKSLR